MSRPNLWFLPRAFFRTGAMGAASSRPSLRPLVVQRDMIDASPRALCAAGSNSLFRVAGAIEASARISTVVPDKRAVRVRRSGIHNPRETYEARWPIDRAQPHPPRRMDPGSSSANACALPDLPGTTTRVRWALRLSSRRALRKPHASIAVLIMRARSALTYGLASSSTSASRRP